MLHSNPTVCLRFPRARLGISETQFGWRACNGMGYSRGRGHGEYRGSLCVSSLSIPPGKKIEGLLPLDAYTNDCFPKHQGEISALLNLARVLGGFSVAYFQVPWAMKH